MNNTIVICSVLKPVDDVRAFRKIAQSLSKTNKYDIYLIGNKESEKYKNGFSIKLITHYLSRRNYTKRFLLRWKIALHIVRLCPKVVIITTHELLLVSIFLKLFLRFKLLYDVQENHVYNIRYVNPSFLRKVMAMLVGLKSRFAHYFIDEYWLAEKCYLKEIQYLKDNVTVVENKACTTSLKRERNQRGLKLLFTGSISLYSGIDKLLHFHHRLKERLPSCELHIIGQVHNTSLMSVLKKTTRNDKRIVLDIDYEPIPYDRILQAIHQADVGFVYYPSNRASKHRLPTKVYEYSRYQLPYVVPKDSFHGIKAKELGGAILVDTTMLSDKDIDTLLEAKNIQFEKYRVENTWENEEQKVLKSIDRLML